MGFFTQLQRRAQEIDSLLCVGLDPHPDQLSKVGSRAALDFCIRLVDSTFDIALAYKPNSAFFEFYGSEGYAVLHELIEYIPEGIPIVLDAKRGDIASSAKAYADGIFGKLGVNAVTVNPYLGLDAINPFLQNCDQGVFLLCKTSNPGSEDFQDLYLQNPSGLSGPLDGGKLYELIASKAVEWNIQDNLGLVVGATQIRPLRSVRRIATDLWLLTPGVGAQGGDLELALEAGLRADGFGMLIPVSRGISTANDPRQAAFDLKERINHFRNDRDHVPRSSKIASVRQPGELNLAIDILKSGCVQFGDFTLKSGIHSPIYIDLRRLTGLPDLLVEVARSYKEILIGLQFDQLAGIPYAGLPIATAVSLLGNWSLVYPRKESKSYGTQVEVEGIFDKGQKVVLIDDLATTGGSKFEAIEKLAMVGLSVEDVVVLIDRESGAALELLKSGYIMHSVYTLTQLLHIWNAEDLISNEQVVKVKQFLQDSKDV